jgi:hypothetical protein
MGRGTSQPQKAKVVTYGQPYTSRVRRPGTHEAIPQACAAGTRDRARARLTIGHKFGMRCTALEARE